MENILRDDKRTDISNTNNSIRSVPSTNGIIIKIDIFLFPETLGRRKMISENFPIIQQNLIRKCIGTLGNGKM